VRISGQRLCRPCSDVKCKAAGYPLHSHLSPHFHSRAPPCAIRFRTRYRRTNGVISLKNDYDEPSNIYAILCGVYRELSRCVMMESHQWFSPTRSFAVTLGFQTAAAYLLDVPPFPVSCVSLRQLYKLHALSL